VFILDRLMIGSIRFVLDKLVQVAESELDDAEHLRDELLSAQMSLELGEIDEEEFAVVETRVLGRLRELREEELQSSRALERVEVEVDFDEGHSDFDEGPSDSDDAR
jgi:hypothetical protein